MEIVHIVLGKANPNRLNGVNKVVYNLATEQVKAGKNVQVWGLTPNPTYDFPERNFETVLFKMYRNPFQLDQALQHALIQKPNAVYHLHGGWIPAFYSLAKLFSKHQIKFVLTPHGAYNTLAIQQSKIKKWFYFNLFEKHLLRAVHQVHAIGASETEGLKKLSPQTQSFLLPYGFAASINQVAHPKEKDFTLGFVGRLDMHTKGLDLLLKAFNLFQKKISNSKLWIIGDGDSRKTLEQICKNDQLQNVVFWGSKFGAEKDELISRMHVFTHPSRNE
jgi:glycosyltransferase involved in cell wall biosynthesis